MNNVSIVVARLPYPTSSPHARRYSARPTLPPSTSAKQRRHEPYFRPVRADRCLRGSEKRTNEQDPGASPPLFVCVLHVAYPLIVVDDFEQSITDFLPPSPSYIHLRIFNPFIKVTITPASVREFPRSRSMPASSALPAVPSAAADASSSSPESSYRTASANVSVGPGAGP